MDASGVLQVLLLWFVVRSSISNYSSQLKCIIMFTATNLPRATMHILGARWNTKQLIIEMCILHRTTWRWTYDQITVLLRNALQQLSPQARWSYFLKIEKKYVLQLIKFKTWVLIRAVHLTWMKKNVTLQELVIECNLRDTFSYFFRWTFLKYFVILFI